MFYLKSLAGLTVIASVVVNGVFSISSLTSSPRTADQNGVAGVCPNVQLSFTCSIDGQGTNFTSWTSTSPGCLGIVQHVQPANVACGSPAVLDITSVSNSATSSDRSSVALLNNPVDNQVVSCLDGPGTTSPLVGQISLCLIGSPIFTALRQDNSQATVSSTVVDWTPPSKCPGDNVTYTVIVSDESGSDVQSSTTDGSSVNITSLVPNSVYSVNVTADNSCGATYSEMIAVEIRVEVLPPALAATSLACTSNPLIVNVQWEFNTTTRSGSTLYPTPDFVYINSTSLSGEANVTQVAYPATSTSLSLTRQMNYTVVVSSFKEGFGESMNNPQVTVNVQTFSLNNGTLSTNDCLTVTLNPQCSESVSLFTPQLSYGLCTGQRETITGSFDSTTNSICLTLSNIPLGQICYEVSLSYNDVLIEGSAQSGMYSFSGCTLSQLDTIVGSGVTYSPNGSESSPGVLPHGTGITFACGSSHQLKGPQMSVCRDGTWTSLVIRSCQLSPGVIAAIVIILCILLLLAVITAVVIVVYFCCCQKKAKDEALAVELKEKEEYTGDEYAVVDTSKKKKKPAVVNDTTDGSQSYYQDPSTIQHEQAPAGDLYAVAETRKGSKKEKSEQELAEMYSVPDKSKKSQLTYADIDIGAGSGKPVNPVPEMEYATVVN